MVSTGGQLTTDMALKVGSVGLVMVTYLIVFTTAWGYLVARLSRSPNGLVTYRTIRRAVLVVVAPTAVALILVAIGPWWTLSPSWRAGWGTAGVCQLFSAAVFSRVRTPW